MSEEKWKDIDQLMYRELPPDRYCYIHNYIIDLKSQLQQKENIIKEIKAQLDYLETYSSKEDVFEDMKRRLDRIEQIIGENNDK